MLSGRPMHDKGAQKEVVEHLNRACEPCRALKVRCLPDTGSQSVICQRCSKSGRSCVFAPPQKRRQRVRTDTRVAELEREVRAMRALLISRGGSFATSKPEDQNPAEPENANVGDERKSPSSIALAEFKYNDGSDSGQSFLASQPRTPEETLCSTATAATTASFDGQAPKSSPRDTIDFVDRGLLSLDTAYELFKCYVNDLIPLYPAVVFPVGYTASAARKERPVLFAAVITAASCHLGPILFSTLSEEMIRIYAERIFVKGEKSLELVQAMSVSSIWYCPPDVGEKAPLKFFQHINLAASMALDIGLGTYIDGSTKSLEECKTLLACYLACAGVSMRMRRPSMLRWTSDMGNCLQALETAPTATLCDRRFAAWVKLQNIADEYLESTARVDESRLQPLIKSFEKSLENWKMSAGPDIIDVSLELVCHQNSIYLYEAIFGGADPLDFNHLVFNLKESDIPPAVKRFQSQPKRPQKPLSAASVSAITACIDSSHAQLNAFLTLEMKTLRISSVVIYVRMTYALVILIKLFISAKDSSNELNKILDPWSLKIDIYLPAIIERVTMAAGPKRLRIPTKWLSILAQINVWYRYHEILPYSEKADPVINLEPLCKSALQSNAYLNARYGESPTSLLVPGVIPVSPEATPQTMFSNSTHQAVALSVPEVDPNPMNFAQGEGDFSFTTPSAMSADTNDWMTQSNSNIAFDMNWDPAELDWGYDFK